MKRPLGWGSKTARKLRRSGQKAVILGAWRTGSFKPVGDGFEDGVLFCDQKASALFRWNNCILLRDILKYYRLIEGEEE